MKEKEKTTCQEIGKKNQLNETEVGPHIKKRKECKN